MRVANNELNYVVSANLCRFDSKPAVLKKIIFLPFFLLLCCNVFCQSFISPPLVDVSDIKSTLNIENATFIIIDSGHQPLSFSGIFKKPFSLLKKFYSKDKIPARLVTAPLYLSFALINSSNHPVSFYYFPGLLYDKTTLYTLDGNNVLKTADNNSQKEGYLFLSLNAREQKHYLLKLIFTKTNGNSIESVLIKPNNFQFYVAEINPSLIQKRTAGYILSGVLLMMILFTLVNYFITRKSAFLFNGLYCTCMFLLILFTNYFSKNPGAFKAFFISYFDLILLVSGNIAYLVFTRKFLETQRLYPRLNYFLKAEENVLLILMISYTFLHFATSQYSLQTKLENLMKIIVMMAAVVYIVASFIVHNRLMTYLAIGSSIQLSFSIISYIFILKGSDAMNLFTSPLFYFETGVIFSLIFFILGLAYKNRIELIETVQEQEALKLEAEKQSFASQLNIIKAQQEERNRISADMHDDLGAGMTSIRLYSEIAKTKLANISIPEIDKISSSANELINKMNAIIWSMSSHNDNLANMVAYIRSYIVEYFEDTHITANIFLPEKLPAFQVPGTIRRNVFLVIKEALHNVVKHSKATEVTITLQKHTDGISLSIQDNGTGIDFKNLRAFSNGLSNMKKRMKDIDTTFSIENNNGTLVTLFRKTR